MSGLISAWSFSRLEPYEKCPYRIKLEVVDKRDRTAAAGADSKAEVARLRGKVVHEGAEQFIKGKITALPTELTKHAELFKTIREEYAAAPADFVIEDEWAFDIDWQPTGWFDDNAWLRMKLDYFKWLDPERTAGDLRDWKTGKKMHNEVKHGQQGQLFAIGAFMRFPTLQALKVQFEYVDEGKHSLPKTYSREQAMAFLPSFDRRGKALTTATTFPPKPNRINCAYCPFGPSKGDGSCEYGVEV